VSPLSLALVWVPWAWLVTWACRRGVAGRSISVPLDLFSKTLEAAVAKTRRSVRIVTSSLASTMLGLEEEICSEDVNIVLESWLTQQEEQHEVGWSSNGGRGAIGWSFWLEHQGMHGRHAIISHVDEDGLIDD
jgi:hypothetical protein